jgi:hypothetical protein
MQLITNDTRPRSISLDAIPCVKKGHSTTKNLTSLTKEHHKQSSLSGGEKKLSYKQQWYKKNSKNVKGYNKEYYQKYKEKLRQKAIEKYNLLKHNSKK